MFKPGDKVWYFGPHLPHGLYTYKEPCQGLAGVFGDSASRHRVSNPERFKIPRIDLHGKRAGHTYGYRVCVYEVWLEEIRTPTAAEYILYGNGSNKK